MAEITDQVLGQTIEPFVKPDDGGQPAGQEPDYLNLLVGEGKKFTGNVDLAKGHAHLQSHAKTLEEENASLRAQISTSASSNKTVEDILAAIKPPVVNDPDPVVSNNTVPQLSKEDVQALITGTLDQRSQVSAADAEIAAIKVKQADSWSKLSEVYGDEAKAKAAVAMYMGQDASKQKLIQDLGSSDPDMLVKLMTVAVPPQGEQVDFGSADAGSKHNVEKPYVPAGLVTYEQEQAVKKTNRKHYDSAGFQALIHKSAKEGVWKRPTNKSIY